MVSYQREGHRSWHKQKQPIQRDNDSTVGIFNQADLATVIRNTSREKEKNHL